MEKIPSLIKDIQLDPSFADLIQTWTATRMWDGLPYAVINGQPYTHLSSRVLTDSMLLCNTVDNLFHGWVPVPPDDTRFWNVWNAYDGDNFNWTYELIGPNVNGNPEHATDTSLQPHGRLTLRGVGHTVESIEAYLASHPIKGIVWWENIWNQTCRKVKVQQSDFGFKRRNK